MLAVIYIAIFALQLFLLIRCFRRRTGWGKLLLLNIGATVLACTLGWYFDTLPGYGMMPGWAYFAEVFYSLCAALVFGIQSLVTTLGLLLRKKK